MKNKKKPTIKQKAKNKTFEGTEILAKISQYDQNLAILILGRIIKQITP